MNYKEKEFERELNETKKVSKRVFKDEKIQKTHLLII